MARAIIAGATAAAAAVLALLVHRHRKRLSSAEELTIEEAERRFSSLPVGVCSAPLVFHGLRAMHRQRLSKSLHFLSLRSASGLTIETVLKAGTLSVDSVTQLYQLGDALTVHGTAEVRAGRLSIRATRLETDEAWSVVFAKAPFVYERDVAGAAGAAGNVILQVPPGCLRHTWGRRSSIPQKYNTTRGRRW